MKGGWHGKHAHGVTIYRRLNADETQDQGRGCDVQIYEIRRDGEDVSVEGIYTLCIGYRCSPMPAIVHGK